MDPQPYPSCNSTSIVTDSMSINGKFKFKDSLARNILSRSNMDHCLAEKINIKGVNELFTESSNSKTFARNM